MKFLFVSATFFSYIYVSTACQGGINKRSISIPLIPTDQFLHPPSDHSNKKRCVHKDSQILMADGRSVKKAGDLLIGDRVWSENSQGSPVILMPDTQVDQVHPFIIFKTKTGRSIKLTPDHAVFARPCGVETHSDYADWPIKRSGDLTLGECVPLVNGQEDRVMSVSSVEMSGRVHPITESGKLVVDGVVASCYDYDGVNATQDAKHAPFEPARMLYSFGEKIYETLSNDEYAIGLLNSLIRGMGLDKVYE